MESRDFSDCTRNIHRPFTPEKDVTKNKTPWERLPKATDSKAHGCLDTDFGEVLFHYVIFTTKKMSIFRVRSPRLQIARKLPLQAPLLVKFPHSPILHYAFSSWIEKTMTKTIDCHWENRFVLQ